MTFPGSSAVGNRAVPVLELLRAIVERLLPWYSPERTQIRAARTHHLVSRADELTERIRAAYRADDERLLRR